MRRVKYGALSAFSCLVGSLVILVCVFELAYRQVLSSLDPLPTVQQLPPLPPKVATALWAAVAKRKPGLVPRIYGWNLYKVFDEEDRSLVLASQVARPIATRAYERSQARGMLQWHTRLFAASVWVTRNFSTDEILATYANGVWMGTIDRGFAGSARRLFRKELAELDYPDIALLIAVSRNPKSYDPIRNAERAKEMRNRILQELFQAGILSASSLRSAQASPLGVNTITL